MEAITFVTVHSYSLPEMHGKGILIPCKYQGNEGRFTTFTEALARNTSCTHLWMNGNKFGPAGAKQIAAALKFNTTLISLTISANAIGNEGTKGIVDALKVNSTLTRLGLEGNMIGPEGAKDIADALKVNTGLTSLNLRANNIFSAGAKELARALKFNNTLNWLCLDLNGVHEGLLDQIQANLGPNRFRDNANGPSEAKEVAKALKVDTGLTSLEYEENMDDFLQEQFDAENSVGFEENFDVLLNQIAAELKQNKDKPTPKKARNNTELIKTAFKNGVQVPYGRSKLMIIGQGRAGKTSTVRTLLGESFEYQKSTKGINAVDRLTTRKWKRMDRNFRQDLQEAGAKAVAKLQNKKNETKESKVASRASQHDIAKTQRNRTTAKSPVSKTRGHPKNDSKKSIVEPIRIDIDEEEVAKKFDSHLVLSKDSQSGSEVTFTIWDFGGQEVFYTLHHVFLTKYGVYLLVFNMEELLTKTDKAVDYLKFWLDSVKLHAPNAPIVLIGTFHDVINEESKLEQVNTILCNALLVNQNLQICSGNDSDYYFYPLDNTVGEHGGVVAIRKQIEDIVLSVSGFDVGYITKPVKLAWTYFIDLLAEKEEPTIKRSEVLKIASTCSITEQEMEKVLNFFHELGIIVYFGSDEQLRSHITFQPQWLIDAFACVIYDPQVHMKQSKNLNAKLKSDHNAYIQSGILTSALLQELLKEYHSDDFVYLVKLLEKMLLISPWIFDENSDSLPRYLVPSLLKYKTKSKKHEFNYDGPSFYLDFGELMPTGIFQRILCQFVEQSCQYEGSARPTIEYSFAALSFGYNTEFRMDLVNGLDENKIQITFEHEYNKEKSFVVAFANTVLQKLRESITGNNLACEVLLTSSVNPNILCSYDKLVQLRREGKTFARTRSQRRKGKIEDYAHWFNENIGDEETAKYDVFLAHEWGPAGDNFPTHEKVKEINGLLKEQGISTWFDDSNMGAVTDIGMTKGIKASRVVIVFITKRYSDRLANQKNNCTKEFLFATSHKEIGKGEIIPVVLDEEMLDHRNWGDRLEINIPRVNMYISMTSSEELESNLHALVSRIREVQD